MTQKFLLPCYGIKVDVTEGGTAKIQSDLFEAMSDEFRTRTVIETHEAVVAGVDAIESLILAHASAGIDVSSPAYVEGVETAVDAFSNNLD